MSTELQNSQSKLTAKALFNSEQVQKKFNELLGKRASAFITSVLQVITNNDLLSKADPMSIYHAATVAATLDLPINQNLGFAYIVPYNSKNGCQAQFQMGYKGFIQLAQRSGQFKKCHHARSTKARSKKPTHCQDMYLILIRKIQTRSLDMQLISSLPMDLKPLYT